MQPNILVKNLNEKLVFCRFFFQILASVQIKLTFVDLYLNEIHNGIGQSLPLQANFSARIHNLKIDLGNNVCDKGINFQNKLESIQLTFRNQLTIN
jgi:hypothetical protein